jgi:3-oxoadipate enol-lactonase
MLVAKDNRYIHYDLVAPVRNAPVVCFMHSLMLDGGMWTEQMTPLLQSGLSVLRIDIQGHGGSDPAGTSTTMQGLADDLLHVVDFLDIKTLHLVGLSLGGMIAQAFAITHAERIVSLMLCDTLPVTLTASKGILAERIETVRQNKSVSHLADATMQRFLTEDFKARNPVRWRELHDTIEGTDADGYVACGTATLDFDFTQQLRSFPARTLVICGGDDPLTPPQENRKLAALVPHAKYEEISGARHLSNVENPAAFNRTMLEWLTKGT